MNKYMMFGFMLAMQALKVSAMGPVPMLNPAQTYQTNPANRMTPQQRYAVSQAFGWAQGAFQKNHSVCRNRGECLNLDLKSLASYISMYPRQPATLLFQNIYNIIRQDSQNQKFVSQWVIFRNLSPARQAEYQNGVRVTPVKPQYVRTVSGTITPALFNQDDVLTDLLQQVDHYHKNCNQYITCLRGDLQLISNLYKRLSSADPVRISLRSLSQIISNLANQKTFNTSLYLTLYNPLGQNWYDVSRKQKANKLGAYGYSEWKNVERSSRATSWRAPRFTNGIFIPQNQLAVQPPLYSAPPPPGSFRSNVEGIRSKSQAESQKTKSWWEKNKDWVKDNKDLFKGWW